MGDNKKEGKKLRSCEGRSLDHGLCGFRTKVGTKRERERYECENCDSKTNKQTKTKHTQTIKQQLTLLPIAGALETEVGWAEPKKIKKNKQINKRGITTVVKTITKQKKQKLIQCTHLGRKHKRGRGLDGGGARVPVDGLPAQASAEHLDDAQLEADACRCRPPHGHGWCGRRDALVGHGGHGRPRLRSSQRQLAEHAGAAAQARAVARGAEGGHNAQVRAQAVDASRPQQRAGCEDAKAVRVFGASVGLFGKGW